MSLKIQAGFALNVLSGMYSCSEFLFLLASFLLFALLDFPCITPLAHTHSSKFQFCLRLYDEDRLIEAHFPMVRHCTSLHFNHLKVLRLGWILFVFHIAVLT